MRICGREYRLVFSKSQSGGAFWCYGKDESGQGEIRIKSQRELHATAEILCHEALEAIFAEDGVRFANMNREPGNENMIIMFDHHYFNTVGPKLLDALLSSGMFKLIDNRKQKGR